MSVTSFIPLYSSILWHSRWEHNICGCGEWVWLMGVASYIHLVFILGHSRWENYVCWWVWLMGVACTCD